MKTNTTAKKATAKKATSKPQYSASKTRKVKVPGCTCSVLTVTSKMPGPSFSLPAGKSCPNSHGEICDHCYAKQGCYRYDSTAKAQTARFQWAIEMMRTPAGQAEFIEVMVAAIMTSGVTYFRGHDSGDFFSVAYLESWVEVCKRLPNVKVWFPTREYQVKPSNNPFAVIQPNPRMEALRKLAALPNVTVRPSALEIGAEAPVVPGLAAGSGVNAPNAFICPAPTQNGECRDCRHCWDNPDVATTYPLHGVRVTPAATLACQ